MWICKEFHVAIQFHRESSHEWDVAFLVHFQKCDGRKAVQNRGLQGIFEIYIRHPDLGLPRNIQNEGKFVFVGRQTESIVVPGQLVDHVNGEWLNRFTKRRYNKSQVTMKMSATIDSEFGRKEKLIHLSYSIATSKRIKVIFSPLAQVEAIRKKQIHLAWLIRFE